MIDHQIHSKCKSILAYFRFSYNCFLDCEMGLIMYSRTASYNLNFVLILSRNATDAKKLRFHKKDVETAEPILAHINLVC